MMVYDFEKAAYNTRVDEISMPIKQSAWLSFNTS